MRLNADALPDFVVLGGGRSLSLALSTTQATITVNSSADNTTSKTQPGAEPDRDASLP